MLVIRPEQMKVLNASFEMAFRIKVRDYLRSDFPEQYQALGPNGVDDLIESGITKAARYGIDTESDVCELIGGMALLGKDFDRMPWAAKILQDTDESATARVSRLTGWVQSMRKIVRGT